MGALARVLAPVLSFGRGGPVEQKMAVGAAIPSYEDGQAQNPRYWHNYWRFALEGYSRNEIVFACVEELATSAAEPRLVAMRKGTKGKPEQLADHPVLELFEHPNPFMSRFQLIASLVMFRAIAGSSYLNIGRSAAGKAVELWSLRPDRVFVIPDRQKHIGGWEYRLETETFFVPTTNMIQSRTRNPVDDYYGLPPLAVCAERVDSDAMMRQFTLAFFRNAGVPSGLLNITKQVSAAERQLIKDKFRNETGAPQNWHSLLVLDATEANYVKVGASLEESVVFPQLDEISEARIAMAFGVPPELIGARLGMLHGNRSTTLAARAGFWDETCAPMYQELAADFTRGLKADYDGTADEFDYLEFDTSTVKALQEDEDAKHKRIRDDLQAGLISVQEARVQLGHDADYASDALLILARGLEPMTAADAMQGSPDPTQPMGAAGGAPATKPASNGNGHSTNGNGNGHGRTLTPADLEALQELATGRDN